MRYRYLRFPIPLPPWLCRLLPLWWRARRLEAYIRLLDAYWVANGLDKQA